MQKNKASTVLQYFEQGVQESGLPFRVQGDQGIENLDVARNVEVASLLIQVPTIIIESAQHFTRICLIPL